MFGSTFSEMQVCPMIYPPPPGCGENRGCYENCQTTVDPNIQYIMDPCSGLPYCQSSINDQELTKINTLEIIGVSSASIILVGALVVGYLALMR